jgi:hypothetical protein
MANSSRGGGNRGGGSQQQGGGGQLLLELFVSGVRNAVELTVRLLRGNNPLAGESVTFFTGSDANPYKAQVMDPVSGDPLAVQISSNGVGTKRLDLSSLSTTDFTTITACFGAKSVNKPLPTDVKVEGKSPDKPKQLKIEPSDEVIESMSNIYNIDIITLDKTGKIPTTTTVRFSSDNPVDLIDRSTGTSLATNTTFVNLNVPSGVLDLRIIPAGPDRLERKVRFILDGTTETVRKQLRFR